MATLGNTAALPNFTIRKWTSKHERAVPLVAEDKLSDEEIAAELEITRQWLDKWKRDPQFQERVAAYREEVRAALVAKGIRDKENRLRDLQMLRDAHVGTIEARKRDERLRGVPGAEHGLIVAEPVIVRVFEHAPVRLGDPTDPDDEIVVIDDRDYLAPAKRSVMDYKYTSDTATAKELRETLKQAAIEMGEWNEKDPQKGAALDVLMALAAFGRGEFDTPKQLPKATARAVEPEDWGMPEP